MINFEGFGKDLITGTTMLSYLQKAFDIIGRNVLLKKRVPSIFLIMLLIDSNHTFQDDFLD